MGLVELERLDGAAVVRGGHLLYWHPQVLTELVENRRPASPHLRGGSVESSAKVISFGQLGSAARPTARLRSSSARAGREREETPDDIWHPPNLDGRPAGHGTEMTSTQTTMATMSKITVAASRSLKARMVSQR